MWFRGGIGFQPMIGEVHRQDADATLPATENLKRL
jgi:hypothetical protein